MQISYTVSSMVFWWRENPLSFEQECQFLESLGFGIELWPTIKGQNDCRYERRRWPRLAAATEGMLVSMRSRTDKPSLHQWAEQIECAELLKANIVTDLKSFGVFNGSGNNGFDFAAEVVKLADERKVKLCLETGQLSKLKEVHRKFDSIWYCFDVGHVNLDAECDFRQYVDELAPRIAHVHLTDNYGQFDDHEPPGLRGGVPRRNWSYLLDRLEKYNNEIIGSFEMCPCMPAVMIRKGIEFVFDELKWPNQPRKQPVNGSVVYNPI